MFIVKPVRHKLSNPSTKEEVSEGDQEMFCIFHTRKALRVNGYLFRLIKNFSN